jgi:hypothetical protein
VKQNPNAAGGLLCALVCILVVLAGVLAIYIFFCLTLQRTQTAVHPRNRLIPPGIVWLHCLHLGQVIPFAGLVFSIGASIWDIIMVVKLSGSLKLEFEDRGWRTDGEGFGRMMGLVWSVGQVAGLPLGFAIGFLAPQVKEPAIAIAVFAVIVGLGVTLLVCWIVFWVQMAGYGRRLREGRARYRPGRIEDDFDDEYRPPLAEPVEGDEFKFDDDRRAPRPRHDSGDEHDDYDDRRDRPRRDEY